MSSEDIPHLTDERSGKVGSSGRNLANAVQLENLNFFAFDFFIFFSARVSGKKFKFTDV
jgi:hypothetical protein